MTAAAAISIAIGLVLLVLGAELLVKGAAAIASKLGVPPIVIGLTVVAFGTSAPELAVSVSSGVSGDAGLAFGNVVGSNIVNVLFILGASSLVTALAVTQRIVRLDVPLVIGATIVVLLMALDNSIGRLDGVILVGAAITYTVWLIRGSRGETGEVVGEYAEAVDELEGASARSPLVAQIGLVVAGLAALVGGSQLLVNGATDIAENLGVSDLVIGLTVVAVGTSLPELATSMLAALRGQRDIAVGNVVGSNLFNLLFVLGATGIVSPDGVGVSDTSLKLDLPVALLAVLVLVPIMWNGFQIERWEGAVLIAGYVAYVAYLVLDAGGNSTTVVEIFAFVFVPAVFVIFGVTGWQGWRRHRARPLAD